MAPTKRTKSDNATDVHPNLVTLSRIDLRDLEASKNLIADEVIWYFFNPNLPDVEGDYVGFAGIRAFFGAIAEATAGTFQVNPISATPIGDDLVVVHTKNTMTMRGQSIAVDIVVVWRFENGKVAEVWDIVSGKAQESQYG